MTVTWGRPSWLILGWLLLGPGFPALDRQGGRAKYGESLRLRRFVSHHSVVISQTDKG